MKLHERFGDKGFHTCIATTFGIDFDAYEGVALPRLRGAGCNNNLVLMDARMLTHALESASALPAYAGRHYTLNGVSPRGVFHSKILLQLGRASGRLIVGSANLTSPGLGGNLEVAGVVSWKGGEAAERRLIASAWAYLSGLIDTNQDALAYQVDWITRRTRWLGDTEPANGPIQLSDGSSAAFLAGNRGEGISEQFVRLVGAPDVRRLVVVSPYWDTDLAALRNLSQRLGSRATAIVLGGLQPSIPVDALEGIANVGLYDIGDMAKSRFVHAKVIIAQTKDADHVLFGSANCTAAALGGNGFRGINEEACLYRRMGAGESISALALTNVFTPASRVDKQSLPPYAPRPELPLDAAMLRYPGRFEATEDRVYWWPSPGFAKLDSCQIALLDSDGSILPCELRELSSDRGGCRRFSLAGLQDVPSFGRVRFDGGLSAPAVVVMPELIRNIIREARGKHAERVAERLAAETEEGLWLLEAYDVLFDSEVEDAADQETPQLSRHRQDAGGGVQESIPRTLSYEEFMAGRKLRGEGHAVGKSDFAGTELSLVRHCLNRLLGLDSSAKGVEAPDDESIRQALATRDEADDENESAGDGTASASVSSKKDADAEFRKVSAKTVASREQLLWAVSEFNERVRIRAPSAGLTHRDVLRLRVMLMILLAAARPVEGLQQAGSRSMQVLNAKGADSWPLLLGKLLFAFFGGKDPAIKYLRIDRKHDEVPVEILEGLAISLWTINACKLALMANVAERSLLQRINALGEQIYKVTGLDRAQLQGDHVSRLYAFLSKRFASSLSLGEDKLGAMHLAAIERCITPTT